MSLAQAQVGVGEALPRANRLRVVSLSRQASEIQHLSHLGFCPGAEFQVISRRFSGSVVVLLGESRLELGAWMAKQVVVAQAG